MRIESIHIESFLSFREFEWPNLDPQLNLIVGPNGAGKTNLFHALRLVVDVLGYYRRSLWARSVHGGSADRRFTISLVL